MPALTCPSATRHFAFLFSFLFFIFISQSCKVCLSLVALLRLPLVHCRPASVCSSKLQLCPSRPLLVARFSAATGVSDRRERADKISDGLRLLRAERSKAVTIGRRWSRRLYRGGVILDSLSDHVARSVFIQFGFGRCFWVKCWTWRHGDGEPTAARHRLLGERVNRHVLWVRSRYTICCRSLWTSSLFESWVLSSSAVICTCFFGNCLFLRSRLRYSSS